MTGCTERGPSSTDVVLDDGRVVGVRPMRPDDASRLREMHRHFSPTTIYQRFLCQLPDLPIRMAERFARVDGHDRAALVAVDEDGRLVAVGRYDRLEPGGTVAEIALVVDDRYQRHGLGTVLVRLLVAAARHEGLRTFVADALATNLGIRRTLRDAGLVVAATHDEGGVVHLVLPLPVPPEAAASATGAGSALVGDR